MHRIAACPPQRVVDLVKAVEIDQGENDDAETALRQRIVEMFDHGALIGQSGQRVVANRLARGRGPAIERARQPPRDPCGNKTNDTKHAPITANRAHSRSMA